MDLSLQRHQYLIWQLRKSKSAIDAKQLLNEVVLFLNNTTHNQTDGFLMLTVFCQEIAGFSTLKFFNDPQIMNHQFFILLSSTFKMFLTKLIFIPLTKQDEQCFDGISLLISNLCLYKNRISTCFYTDNNEKFDPNNKEKFNLISYEKIFFTELFMKKFVKILENDIAENDYEPYHIKYKIMDRLLRLFMKLNDIDHKLILDSILKCVESKIYIKLYKNIDLREPMLTPKQSLFMYQCPKFIRLYSDKRQDDISYSLCKLMTKYSTGIFEKHSSIVLYQEKEHGGAKIQAIAWYIQLLNHFALTPTTREFFIRSAYSDNKTIVDQMIEILETEALVESVRKNAELFHADVALVSYSITLLYNLTFEKKIFHYLKDKNVNLICIKLRKANDKTIQFASRTLEAILNKENIDIIIDSPTTVARSYLYFIENTIDDVTLTYHGIKLDGVLSNLEDIVQNDLIKEEITNDDDGIPLLSRCAYTSNLDIEKIQSPALRIIDAISFANDSAITQIREDDDLMDHVKSLSDKNDKHQAATANRILWKVKNEPEFISQQVKQEKKHPITINKVFNEKKAIYQYVAGDYRFTLTDHIIPEKFDIMISYCQDDKEICYKIYNRLTESNFYRVSFDKDNLHNSNPEAMAKAIEKSAIVIVCFSTKYRNSYACRLEAEFAKKRERSIIPVKVDPHYIPTGWLKEMIGENKWVDFTDAEFNTVYAQLIDEINEVDK